jgi:predicted dehydrogenase
MAFPDRLPESRVPDPRVAPRMRWGVIGTGWIADRFVRALQQNTDQSVLAVAARNAERAAVFAQAHGIERSHSTPEQMVSGADLDVVYVATTHPAHLPTALLSLEAGKPTVVEKPLGLNASEARRIADAARQARVFCMEALWMVFLPKFDVIRQILYSGLLGDVRSVLADHGEWFPADHRIMDAAQAGGPMLDLGTYPVSFATWVLGAPLRVQAAGQSHPSGVNGEAVAILTAADDRLAMLHTTILGNTPTRASVIGTEASLEIDGPFYQPGPFVVRSSDGTRILEYREPAIGHAGLHFEAAEAVRCIAAGAIESPIRPLADSIATLDVMDEIRRQIGIRYPTESGSEGTSAIRAELD